jgi:hypothetical protein
MKKTKLSGAALAMGAATLFSVAPVFASSSDAQTIQCKGINSCKGQSTCQTATNSCSGQNSCKGQGVLLMTKEECQKAGGTVVPEKNSSDNSGGSDQDKINKAIEDNASQE